jgi:hypothetical protein
MSNKKVTSRPQSYIVYAILMKEDGEVSVHVMELSFFSIFVILVRVDFVAGSSKVPRWRVVAHFGCIY